MREIALSCGVAVKVSENFIDNMELLDALVDLDEGDGSAVSRVLRNLISKEDKKALYNTIREDGRVPIAKIADVIHEIIEGMGEGAKN